MPRRDKRTVVLGCFDGGRSERSFDVNARVKMDREKQCLQLQFLRQKKPIGYIPVEVKRGCFVFRGMSVNEELRGQGLSSLFLAIFLDYCFQLEVTPVTDKMDKPVIALILQKFGFVPSNMNVAIEVANAGGGGPIVIWSHDRQQIASQFSTRYLQSQNMAVASEKPAHSRTVCVNTSYVLGDPAIAKERAAAALGGGLRSYPSQRAHALLRDLHGGGWPSWLQAKAGASNSAQCLTANEGGSKTQWTVGVLGDGGETAFCDARA